MLQIVTLSNPNGGIREADDEAFYRRVWKEFPLCHALPYELWVKNLHEFYEDCPNIEYRIYDSDVLVGHAVIAPTDDIHVGECMSLWHQFMLPEYRNSGVWKDVFMRAKEVTKLQGYSYLVWTHIRDNKISCTYRKIQ